MKAQTRSILQELTDIRIHHHKDHLLESRGSNIIESAINLLAYIHDHYDPEIADNLEKRFINSIKTQDVKKFKRGIKIIK